MHNRCHSPETRKVIAASVSASYTGERKRAQSLRMKTLWASDWGKQMREALRERNRARRIYPEERARVLALKNYQHRHILQGGSASSARTRSVICTAGCIADSGTAAAKTATTSAHAGMLL